MSVVTLQQLKDDLRITDDDSDTILQTLLDGAEAEARSFCNAPADTTMFTEPDVVVAVFLLVRSKYDLEDARDMERYRSVAETLLQPHRILIGI